MIPSIPQLLLLLVAIAIPFLVFGPVLKKAGFPIWWSMLMVLPFVNIAAIWVFAFVKWPVDEFR